MFEKLVTEIDRQTPPPVHVLLGRQQKKIRTYKTAFFCYDTKTNVPAAATAAAAAACLRVDTIMIMKRCELRLEALDNR